MVVKQIFNKVTIGSYRCCFNIPACIYLLPLQRSNFTETQPYRWRGPGPNKPSPPAVYLFFIFVFYKKYIFDLKIYKNIPGRPAAGRLAARQRGARGFCAKTFAQIIARRSLGPVARQRGGRPPLAARQLGGQALPPLYKGSLVPPTPHLYH